MPIFKITYLTEESEQKTCYETADTGRDAQWYAQDDYADIDRIVKVEQITQSE